MITIRIEWTPSKRFNVSTATEGGNPWGVGIEFPTWQGARSVAEAIADACGEQARIVDDATRSETVTRGRIFRVLECDTGRAVEVNGHFDLSLDVARSLVRDRRHEFDQANNPEPYAPWGLRVIEVIGDEDGLFERPIDWRELTKETT